MEASSGDELTTSLILLSELFGVLLRLTGKTKFIYSSDTQQDAFLKEDNIYMFSLFINRGRKL
jgi:hypothetical protein